MGSTTDSGRKLDVQRNAIDEQIAQLTDQIQNLRSTRNGLAPVSLLSPELLVDIFCLARDMAGGKRRTRTAFSISWVSRDWRYLALSTPLLWNKIDFENTIYFTVSHERARDVELELWVYHWAYTSSIEYIFPLLPQTRALRIESPLNIGSPRKEAVFQRLCASVLRELHVANFDVDTPGLSRISPLLHTLRLEGCTLEPNDLEVFPSLTTLSLSQLKLRIPVGQLLRLLESTPFLQRFKINQILDEVDSSYPTNLPIYLSHLKSLEIGNESAVPIVRFLPSIRIPSTADVVAELQIDQKAESRDFSKVVPSIMACRHAEGEWPIVSLQVMDISSSVGLYVQSLAKHDREISTRIIINTWNDAPRVSSLLELVKPHLLSLKSLDLTNSDVSGWCLGGVFAMLPNLSRISASSTAAVVFLEYFIGGSEPFLSEEFNQPGRQEGPQPLAFPGLREIVLTDMPDYLIRQCLKLGQLASTCSVRKGSGIGIEQFTFARCAIPDGVIANLRKVVKVEYIDDKLGRKGV
ncbi:hypothetical protein BDN72DRAFT_845871 [Pluteus cervinus]|uniref:Uncharacterized protein n=1 Tax=Pluteus cervinus TaxID=181527 RepID=A0ACD3AHC3_9AGAR|nr:hypothetical protein BDN72DRAFT_845871 [Pluteus cervinus]